MSLVYDYDAVPLEQEILQGKIETQEMAQTHTIVEIAKEKVVVVSVVFGICSICAFR